MLFKNLIVGNAGLERRDLRCPCRGRNILIENKHYYGKHLCDKERQGLRRST